eukprot:403372919
MMLHVVKYHKNDCLGVLLGQKQDNKLIVEDIVPLFHQRYMAGPLEIAFDMIESVVLQAQGNQLQIIGLYEAPISSKSNDQITSSAALSIAQQLKLQNHIDTPAIIVFETLTKRREVGDQIQHYQKMDVQGYIVNQNNNAVLATEFKRAEFSICEPYITSQKYLGFCDFDDHFENVDNDWLNRALFN